MTTETIELMTKAEIMEKFTKDNTRFDVALKNHMDRLDRIAKAVTAEMDAVKNIGKEVFGENGGNKVFHTETTYSFILNTEELTELIGADKVKALKNKPRKSTSLKW